MTDLPPSPGQGFGPPGSGFGPPPPQYAPPHAPQYAAQFAPPPAPQNAPAQPPANGPEFLAVGKRNAVVVDVSGVVFEMSGLTVEFRWPEIRSVHYKASPDGKALMVAVVHLDGRFHECGVEAKPRARLQEWFTQLAWVLGHYRPMG